MSVIIIPRKHLRMPQGRVTAAPEWDSGLLVLQRGRDFARGAGTATGAIAEQITPSGVGWRGGAGKYFSGVAQYKPVTGGSYSVAFELISQSIVDGAAVFSIANSETSGVPRLLFRCSYPRKFDVYWNGAYNILAGAQWTAGERVLCVFSHDGSVGRLWINGAVAGSAAVGFDSGSEANNWYVGSGYHNQFDAAYLWQVQFSRHLIPDEAVEISRNPWQLFRADPLRIYSLPSGPISISWSSLTASNITQTGATLTLGGIVR